MDNFGMFAIANTGNSTFPNTSSPTPSLCSWQRVTQHHKKQVEN